VASACCDSARSARNRRTVRPISVRLMSLHPLQIGTRVGETSDRIAFNTAS
jgi:hypothetical protein